MNGQKKCLFFLRFSRTHLEFSNVPPYVMLWTTNNFLKQTCRFTIVINEKNWAHIFNFDIQLTHSWPENLKKVQAKKTREIK